MNYKEHKAKWSACTKCSLSRERTKVVLAKGRIPCDILLIGEAPGASEDVLGQPFVGPAGHLLEKALEQSELYAYRLLFTNLVACIPRVDGDKIGEPPKECIEECEPRLRELFLLSQCKLIIQVGTLAKKHTKWISINKVEVMHPAAILRIQDRVQQSWAYKKLVVTLESVQGYFDDAYR